MEDGDESAAAAAALGLSPQLFVNEVHGIIADISAEAFEYCLQLRSLNIALLRAPRLCLFFPGFCLAELSPLLRRRPAGLLTFFFRCFSSPGQQPRQVSSAPPRLQRRPRISSG
jgi:hypothetical protein